MSCLLLIVAAFFTISPVEEIIPSAAGDIDAAQTILFDLAIVFQDSASLPGGQVRQMAEILMRLCETPDSVLPSSMRNDSAVQSERQRLSSALVQFKVYHAEASGRDTLRSAFREIFYAFHGWCRPYLTQKNAAANRTAVMLFAASVTCECTRRMCDEYIAELGRVGRNEIKGLDIVIIDSAVSPDLLKEHDVNIIPTAIVTDRTGREFGRMNGGERVRERLHNLMNLMIGESQ